MLEKSKELLKKIILISLVLCSLSITTYAIPEGIAIESTLSLIGQGRLESTHNVTIKLKNDKNTIIWEERFDEVFFKNGRFKVVIGETKPLEYDKLYTDKLSVIIDVDGVETDPIPITAAPYSVISKESLFAKSVPWDGVQGKPTDKKLQEIDGKLIPSQVMDRSISSRMIATINANQIVGVPDGFLKPEDIILDNLIGILDGNKIATGTIKQEALSTINITKITGIPENSLLYWENNEPKKSPILIKDNMLGVGTTIPRGDLHVMSNEATGLLVKMGKVAIGTPIVGSEKLTVAGTIFSQAGGFKFPDGTIQETAVNQGSWQVDQNYAFINGKKVGIGSEAPDDDALLVVGGAIKANEYLGPLNWTSLVGVPEGVQRSAPSLLTSQDAKHLPFWTGTELVKSNLKQTEGKIVIGNTSEDSPLTVEGDIKTTDGIIFGDGTKQITSAASPWLKDEGKIHYSAGKIGIGTDDPMTKLHIKSSIPQIRLEAFGDTDPTYTDIGSGTGYLVIDVNNPTGYLYQIRKNGEPLFNVDQDGKIGINELNPKYDFVIQGEMMATDIIIDGIPSLDGESNEMSIKSGVTIWNEAYSWGDHALEGYLKVEVDPIFTAHPASTIEQLDIIHWNEAYGWGNHKEGGYLEFAKNLEELTDVPKARQNLGLAKLATRNFIVNEDVNDVIEQAKLDPILLRQNQNISLLQNDIGYLLFNKNLEEIEDDEKARKNIGLEIDVDVQGYHPALYSIASLPATQNVILYGLGEHQYRHITLTPFAKTLFSSVDEAQRREQLELGSLALRDKIFDEDISPSTNIHYSKLHLHVMIEGEPVSLLENDAGYLTKSNYLYELSTQKIKAQRNLGLEIGVDVQAYSDLLTSLIELDTEPFDFIYIGADGLFDRSKITPLGIEWIDISTVAKMRDKLELGDLAILNQITDQYVNDYADIKAHKLDTVVMLEGENISLLVNDSEYLAASRNLEEIYDDALARDNIGLRSLAIQDVIIDEDVAITANINAQKLESIVMLEGENVSLLYNDIGYIKGLGSLGVIPVFSESRTLTGSNIFMQDGNIGIGELTDVEEKLHVNGNIKGDVVIGNYLVGDGTDVINIPWLNVINTPNFQLWDEDLDDLSDGELSGHKVGPGIIADHITSGNLSNDRIVDDSLTSIKIKDLTLETVDYKDESVTLEKMAPDSVDTTKLINLTIIEEDLADDSITSIKIVNKTIVNEDLSDDANIEASKLAPNIMIETENNSLLTNDSGFVSGNGQIGAIPIYTQEREIKNSSIFQNPAGLIGINTQEPQKDVHLVGDMILNDLTADRFYGDGENITNLQFYNVVIQDGEIIERMILDENVTLRKMAPDSVDTSKVVNLTLLDEDHSDESVSSRIIRNLTIANEDVSENANIHSNKLATNVMLETENNSLLTNDSGFVSGNGQIGAIPIYTQDREIKNSIIFQTPEGNLGINTQQPGAALELVGNFKTNGITADTFAGDGEAITNVQFYNVVVQDGEVIERMILDENVTLRKMAPSSVDSSKIVNDSIVDEDVNENANINSGKLATNVMLETENNSLLTNDSGFVSGNGTIGTLPIYTQEREIKDSIIVQTPEGNIGIDTLDPQTKLAVSGDIRAETITAEYFIGDGSQISNVQFGNIVIPNQAIGDSIIADESILLEKMAPNSVDTSKIINLTIIEEDLADESVTSIKLKDGTIAEVDIADAAVTLIKMAEDSVDTTKVINKTLIEEDYADESVTSTIIKNLTIVNEDISETADIHSDKLATNVMLETENNSLLTNDSGFVSGNGQIGAIPIYTQDREIKNSVVFQTPEGNLGINTQEPGAALELVGDFIANGITGDTFTGDGEAITNVQFYNVVVQDGEVIERMILDENITLRKMAPDSVDTTKVINKTLIEEDYADESVTSAIIKNLTIVNEDVAEDANIHSDKLATNVMLEGENISLLTNDSQYLKASSNLIELVDKFISRRNLGVEIDVEVQRYHDSLQSISGLTTNPDLMIYTTDENVYQTTPITEKAREFLTYSEASDQRDYFGLGKLAVNDLIVDAEIVTMNAQKLFGTFDNNLEGVGSLKLSGDSSVFSHYYFNKDTFPSATDYKGGIAYSKEDETLYFSHEGEWIELISNPRSAEWDRDNSNDVISHGSANHIPIFSDQLNIVDSSISEVDGELTIEPTGDITLKTAANLNLNIDGNVGIGNTDHDAKLVVEGTLKVNKSIGSIQQNYSINSNAKEIILSNGNKIKLHLESNIMGVNLTFNSEALPDDFVGTFMIIIKNDTSEVYPITWPDEVKWPDGEVTPLTPSGTDIVSLYYDGENFYGTAIYDFK